MIPKLYTKNADIKDLLLLAYAGLYFDNLQKMKQYFLIILNNEFYTKRKDKITRNFDETKELLKTIPDDKNIFDFRFKNYVENKREFHDNVVLLWHTIWDELLFISRDESNLGTVKSNFFGHKWINILHSILIEINKIPSREQVKKDMKEDLIKTYNQLKKP